MNKKKLIIWGAIIASVIFVFNLLHEILGGHWGFDGGPREGQHGRGAAEMGQAGPQGGFGGHHQFMNGPHHDGGFPWLVVFIGLAVLVLLARWLRKKGKTSSMNEFIDTSLLSSHIPVTSQNANILDQWEKNVTTKKENE
jgi:hypothetical protein